MIRRHALSAMIAGASCFVGTAFAASRDVVFAISSEAKKPTIEFVTGGADGCQVRFILPSLRLNDVDAGGETWQELGIEGGSVVGEPGAPGLPVFGGFVAVPNGCEVSVRGMPARRQTVAVQQILPVQREGNKDFALDRELYASMAQPIAPVVLGTPVIMHGVQLVPFTVQPVTYDPRRGLVEVATQIGLDFTFTQGRLSGPSSFVADSFDQLLDDLAVNWPSVRGSFQHGPGTYVLITPDNADVTAAVQPLVAWRKRQGYNVIVATTQQTGVTAGQVKSYLQNLYDSVTPRLEFICLVGDGNGAVRVPTWNEELSWYRGEGDHYYTTLEGVDILADCHVGRLSARSAGEVAIIVNKILGYERTPPVWEDPQWFRRGVLTGDPAESGITTIYCMRWLRAQLESSGAALIDTIYQAPFASRMFTAANRGGSVFAYRGYLGVSGFGTGYIDGLTNGGKLSFAVLPTCESGSFLGSTHSCTEAFLRNPNGGAVGAIGTATAGTNTRFNNCYFAGVWEGILNTGARALGAAHTYGKAELMRNFGWAELPNVEIWSVWNNLMGDPATTMWQNLPANLTVDYPRTLPVGARTLAVTVTTDGGPVAGARVAGTKGLEIRTVGDTDAAGQVLLALPALYTAGPLLVTVTGPDLLPHLGTITLGTVEAYASLTGHTIDDAGGGNGDGQVNAGEEFALSLSLTNLGSQVAGAVVVTLINEGPGLVVTQDSVIFWDIAPGGTVTRGGFRVRTSPDLVNGSVAGLRVRAVSGADEWVSLLQLPIVCADPSVTAVTWSAGDGRAEPGQSGTVAITLRNDGGQAITGAAVRLTSLDAHVLLAGTSIVESGPLPVGSSTTVSFPLQISSEAFGGHLAALDLMVETAAGSHHDLTACLPIGNEGPDAPTGPDRYGYLAFDNLDPSPLAPHYDWVELDPNYGGQGASVGLRDSAYERDDTRVVPLPFTFRYCGEDFDSIAICSNGFASLGTSTLKPFHNLALPSANSPNAMLAVFWDDLVESGTNRTYRWHDAAGGRFVIQWSRMRNADGGVQNCELILLDPSRYPTATGDGIIVMQYEQVANNDVDRAYCTTGIQNLDGTSGITYSYYSMYAAGARSLEPGRAIAFVPIAAAGAAMSSIEPTALSARLSSGGQTSVALQLTAGGAAGTMLYYSTTSDPAATWFTVVPASGVIPAGGNATLTVAFDADGLSDGTYASPLTIYTTGGAPVAIPAVLYVGEVSAVDTSVPDVLTLSPPHPNPFNPRTVLSFGLPAAGHVTLGVYDLAGRRLASLVDEVRAAGPHQVVWEGTDGAGRRLASGTYVARIVAGNETQAQAMQLLK